MCFGRPTTAHRIVRAFVPYKLVAFQLGAGDYHEAVLTRVTTIIIGMAALIAAVLCYNLTVKHINGSSGVAWFEAGCSDDTTPGAMNCAKVLESPYSYFPPKFPGKPARLPRFPDSFLGLLYYSSLLIWMIGVGRPTFSRKRLYLAPLLFVGVGLAFSAYFMVIMYRVIALWCPWCLVTHGLNFLIAMGLVLLWPWRKPRHTEDGLEAGGGAVAAMAVVPHPTTRLLVTTLLAIFLVNYGHFFLFAWRETKKERNFLLSELEHIRSDTSGHMAKWRLGAPCEIARTADHPVQQFASGSHKEPVLDVVVFSDFECPACAKFAEFFRDKVPPLFGGRVQITFRHYPLDQSCNPRAVKTMHPHACSAALLAEQARVLGGNGAFWKAHDFLFEHQSEIKAGEMTVGRLAAALGLDGTAFERLLGQESLAERIVGDVDQGRSCQIPGTPSVFVEGKRVDTSAALNLNFWEQVAEWFWSEKIRTPRPASTRITQPVATPP